MSPQVHAVQHPPRQIADQPLPPAKARGCFFGCGLGFLDDDDENAQAQGVVQTGPTPSRLLDRWNFGFDGSNTTAVNSTAGQQGASFADVVADNRTMELEFGECVLLSRAMLLLNAVTSLVLCVYCGHILSALHVGAQSLTD